MMQLVCEVYWLFEVWWWQNLCYWLWYGCGYVQFIWQENYECVDVELLLCGMLVEDFDCVLEGVIVVQVMCCGMVQGWFVGDVWGCYMFVCYLLCCCDVCESEFVVVWWIINGIDKVLVIVCYVVQFQCVFVFGGW